ncbi:MAG: hypothetical protein NT134_04415 [Chloroflexi bacterium]|nr:hypothetical protein [Chloroflexota bacterium]
MRRNIFLYLALACFLSLIAIFIFDGYMGIYDTTYVTVGEQEQIIEPDYWLPQRDAPAGYEIDYYISAEWGQKVFFRYEIDNRRFASYSTLVQASVWQENEKLFDLFSEEKSIGPFDKAIAEWELSAEELEEPVAGTSNQYTIKISWGEVTRRIVVDFYYPEEYYRDSVPPSFIE